MGVRVDSGAGVSLPEGGTWRLVVSVTSGRVPSAVAPTVTVTPPAGAPVELDVTACGTKWAASYVTADLGVHSALVEAEGLGEVWAVANVVEALTVTSWPDREALDTYLGDHSATDDEMDDALAAETQAQFDACRVPGFYPSSLRQALLRRCARNLALRGLPLAVLRGDSESGDTVLPGSDPEVRRLEKPWRRLTVG